MYDKNLGGEAVLERINIKVETGRRRVQKSIN